MVNKWTVLISKQLSVCALFFYLKSIDTCIHSFAWVSLFLHLLLHILVTVCVYACKRYARKSEWVHQRVLRTCSQTHKNGISIRIRYFPIWGWRQMFMAFVFTTFIAYLLCPFLFATISKLEQNDSNKHVPRRTLIHTGAHRASFSLSILFNFGHPSLSIRIHTYTHTRLYTFLGCS